MTDFAAHADRRLSQDTVVPENCVKLAWKRELFPGSGVSDLARNCPHNLQTDKHPAFVTAIISLIPTTNRQFEACTINYSPASHIISIILYHYNHTWNPTNHHKCLCQNNLLTTVQIIWIVYHRNRSILVTLLLLLNKWNAFCSDTFHYATLTNNRHPKITIRIFLYI